MSVQRAAIAAVLLGVLAGCERASAPARSHDAAPVPVPPPPAIDAGSPFPDRPASIPSCTSDYAPRPDRDPSPMCYVPGGTFDVVALGFQPEPPSTFAHVEIDDFLIDAHETTVEQFVRFLNDLGDAVPCDDLCRTDIAEWLPVEKKAGRFEIKSGRGGLAMDHVSVDQLAAYCAWAGKDVPTFAEWDVAAHVEPGGKRRRFTWGDQWKKGMMNCDEEDCADGIAEVASPGALHDLSPYGVMDMEGNLREQVRGCVDARCAVDHNTGTAWSSDRSYGGFQPVPLHAAVRCARRH